MEHLVSFGFLALPTAFITLALVGALIALVWRRVGIALVLVASLCLFAAATPALSSYLLQLAEDRLPPAVDLHAAQAIVVLGGDVRLGDGAAIPDRLGAQSLERVVYAAAAYRELHLPVAVTGGGADAGHQSEAALMKAALETQFGVPVTWSEERSRTTMENALFTARLLLPAGVTTVVLVTHAWHLPRALWTFRHAGFTPLPWPAPRTALQLNGADDFLPSTGALQDSFNAIHELIGSVYYRWRY